MTRYVRPDMANVWASEALAGDIEAPTDAKIREGWVAQIPPHEWENFIQRRQDEALAYALQTGVPEWSNTTSYFVSPVSYVQGSNGRIYSAVADSVGQNPTSDSGTYWKQAFAEYGSDYSVSTGTANNYILTFSRPYTTFTEALLLRFKAVATNTGASTLTIDGISHPILGGANQALQGNEIIINNIVTVVYLPSITSWVIVSSTGGNVQVPDATQSRHAITYSQAVALTSGARAPVNISASQIVPPGVYLVDTTTNSGITLTIPTARVYGDSWTFIDPNNTWGDRSWLLDLNGLTIEGVAGPLRAMVSNIQFSVWYTGTRLEFF